MFTDALVTLEKSTKMLSASLTSMSATLRRIETRLERIQEDVSLMAATARNDNLQGIFVKEDLDLPRARADKMGT